MLRLYGRFVPPLCIYLVVLSALGARAANDRPLIYGMNPIPSEWAKHAPNDYTWEGQQYDLMKAAGCASVRVGVGWDLVEPNPGDRIWGDIDANLTAMLDRGFEPVLLIVATPSWALLPGQGTPFYPPQPQYRAQFEKFVYDCARRFRGRVRYYEFWNEENGYGWHVDEGYQKAEEYVPWLIHGYNAIKRGDPNALWAIGGLDDNGVGYADDYLGKCYRYMARGYFDAVCEHPYSISNADLWKLDDLRAKMAEHGDAVPIWITELGWTADGREAEVADWITDYLTRLSSDDYSFCKIATYHTAVDFTSEPYGYGLMTYNLDTKPTYAAFQGLPKPTRAISYTPTVTSLGAGRVRITFSSSRVSTAQVMYGLTDAYGMVTARESAATTSHTFTLDGLQPNALYHYRIRLGAGDYADNFSRDYTFTAPNGKVVSLVGDVAVTYLSESRATVSWTTNVPATSRLEWGEDYDYPNSVSGSSLTTSHNLTLDGLHPSTVFQARIVCTRSGYGNMVREIDPIVTRRAPSLLGNPGFESSGPRQPWVIYGRNDGRITGTWYQGITARSGSAFFGSAASWDHKTGGCYQQVGAVPGKSYWVSAWTTSYQVGGTLGADRARVGIDPTGGTDPASPAIVWGPWTWSQGSWTRMDATAIAQADEITIYIDIRQPSGYEWNINAVDDVDLRESDAYAPLADAKSALPGMPVAAQGAICTANFGDHSYVQAPDRTNALRINGLCTAHPGDTVAFTGLSSFVGPEKSVDAAMVAVTARGGASVEPVGMLTREIGGRPMPGQTITLAGPGGQNTLNCFVAICGRVTSAGSGWCCVDDDGRPNALGGRGVMVVLPAGVTPPAVGTMARVQGIAAAQLVAGKWVPVVKARDGGDVRGLAER